MRSRLRAVAALTIAAALAAAVPRDAGAASGTTVEPSTGPETFLHHLTLGLGVQMFTSEDFDDVEYDMPPMGRFAYRYTLKPTIQLAFDLRVTKSSTHGLYDVGGGLMLDADIDYATVWAGLGVRATKAEGAVRPYAQVNAYLVNERLDTDFRDPYIGTPTYGYVFKDSGPGFGVQGGSDFMLSPSVSIPIEASFLTASPRSDLTSFGFGGGLTLAF